MFHNWREKVSILRRVLFNRKIFIFDLNASSTPTFRHCRRYVVKRNYFSDLLTVCDLWLVQLLQALRRLLRLALQDVLEGDDGRVERAGVAIVLAGMPEIPVIDYVSSTPTGLVMSALQVQLESVQLVLDVGMVSAYVKFGPLGGPLLDVVLHRDRQICFQEQEWSWNFLAVASTRYHNLVWISCKTSKRCQQLCIFKTSFRWKWVKLSIMQLW